MSLPRCAMCKKLDQDADTQDAGEPEAKPKKPRKKRQSKEEKERAAFESARNRQAALRIPELDGHHGRLCRLLPKQCQFALNANVDTQPLPRNLEESLPERPVRRKRELEATEVCGILDAETELKVLKETGKRTTVAGTPVRIRVNTTDKNICTIIDFGSSAVSVKRVKFFSKFDTVEKRNTYAKSHLAGIKMELAEIEEEYTRDMQEYKRQLRNTSGESRIQPTPNTIAHRTLHCATSLRQMDFPFSFCLFALFIHVVNQGAQDD